MIDTPFAATMAIEPFGVLCVTLDNVQLFTGSQWLKLRGKKLHLDDIRDGRTHIVDHFRFNPGREPHYGQGDLERRFMSLDMNAVLAIHDCVSGWVDNRYLGRIFDRPETVRVQDAITIVGFAWAGKPLPPWLIDVARELMFS